MSTEGRPLRADARRNRERVLRTAREAFAAEGIAVPLDEIARRAGSDRARSTAISPPRRRCSRRSSASTWSS
ncbi:hypothetical protein [Streptomyces sp. ME19-01-6]|uniref:hypothetical protein n=1 Tax=Streptomyces sp. ME19-01-6 TaxID=3028686 RepID=UPI0039F56C2D